MRISFNLALLMAVSLPAMVYANSDQSENYVLDESVVEGYKLKEQDSNITTSENVSSSEDSEAPKIIKEEIKDGFIEKLVTKEGLVIAQKKVINNEIVERILNEYHPNGRLLRQIISSDSGDIFFAQEYYPNGQRSSSVNYIDDKNKIGIERKYDIKGVLRQEIPWIKKEDEKIPTTIRYGSVKTYYPDGKLAAIFSIGKPGKNTFFDEHGKVIKEIKDAEILNFAPEIDGKNCKDIVVELSLKDLVELYEDEGDISYNSCGLPYRELFVYEANKTLGSTDVKYSYSDKGMLRRITKYKNGKKDNIVQKFDGDGNLTAEIPYQNGLKHGTAKGYFPTGEIAFQKTYENGKVIGNLNCYFPTGEIAADIHYSNGLKDGIAKLSSPNKTEIEFKNGEMISNQNTPKRKQISYINMISSKQEECLNIKDHKENLLLDIEARANTIKEQMSIKPEHCEDLSTYQPQKGLYVCKVDDKIRGYYPPSSNKSGYKILSYNDENSKKIYDIPLIQNKKQGTAKRYSNNKVIAELTFNDDKLSDTSRIFYPTGEVKDILSISEDGRSLLNSYTVDGKLDFSVSYYNQAMEQSYISTPQKDIYIKFYENNPENIREVNKQDPLNFIEYNLALGEYVVYKDAKLHKVGRICGSQNSNSDIEVIIANLQKESSLSENSNNIPQVIKQEDAPIVEGLEELENEIENIKEQDLKLENTVITPAKEVKGQEFKLENAIIPSAKEKKEQELAAKNIGPIAKPDINNLSDVVAKEHVGNNIFKKEENLESKTERFYYPNGNLRKTIKTKGSRTEEVKEYSKTGLLLTDTIYDKDSILIEKYYGSGQLRRKTQKAYTDNVIMAFLSRIDFYNTGKPRYEIRRVNNELLFEDKEYHSNNNLKQETTQVAPLVFITKEYDKNGKLAKEINIVGANVLLKEYNDENRVQKIFLNNKELPSLLDKDSNKLLADSAKIYNNGKLSSEFITSTKSNTIKEYYDDGNLKTEIIFYNNGEISVKSYTTDNTLDKFAYLSPDGKLHIQKPEVRTIPSYRERYWVDYNNPKWIENQDKYTIKSIGRLNLDTAAYILAELEITVPEIIKNIYSLY